jgi:hypothetical protein
VNGALRQKSVLPAIRNDLSAAQSPLPPNKLGCDFFLKPLVRCDVWDNVFFGSKLRLLSAVDLFPLSVFSLAVLAQSVVCTLPSGGQMSPSWLRVIQPVARVVLTRK